MFLIHLIGGRNRSARRFAVAAPESVRDADQLSVLAPECTGGDRNELTAETAVGFERLSRTEFHALGQNAFFQRGEFSHQRVPFSVRQPRRQRRGQQTPVAVRDSEQLRDGCLFRHRQQRLPDQFFQFGIQFLIHSQTRSGIGRQRPQGLFDFLRPGFSGQIRQLIGKPVFRDTVADGRRLALPLTLKQVFGLFPLLPDPVNAKRTAEQHDQQKNGRRRNQHAGIGQTPLPKIVQRAFQPARIRQFGRQCVKKIPGPLETAFRIGIADPGQQRPDLPADRQRQIGGNMRVARRRFPGDRGIENFAERIEVPSGRIEILSVETFRRQITQSTDQRRGRVRGTDQPRIAQFRHPCT